MTPRRTSPRASARGMTLIEIMIVVAIIGVLAALAAFGVRRWINASHVAEATEMVQAIGGAQEQYRADVGAYADVSAGITDAQLCPAYTPGGQGNWDAVNCPHGVKSWTSLNVIASKSLWYGYASRAGAQGSDPSSLPVVTMKGQALNYVAMAGGASAPAPYYIVVARGDVDKNGVYATVFYASFAHTVLVDNDAE